ncbi:MAG: hypothetical protein HZB26_23940 [Candidatus Hydrogenedentes bacterium]|nr:hypothetical protein [Candidatus Hydrogenedentota bacterium]
MADLKVILCPSDAESEKETIGSGWNHWGYGAGWNKPVYVDTPGGWGPWWAEGCNDPYTPQASCWNIQGWAVSYSYWENMIPTANIKNQADMDAVSRAFLGSQAVPDATAQQKTTAGNREKDFSVTLSGGSVSCPALREGIERFMITDINNPAGSAKAQSDVPLMWDNWITVQGVVDATAVSHIPGGSNVLFLDGHVEFGKYSQPLGSKFVMLTKESQMDNVRSFP